ncbi:acid phosphatase PHO1-like [Teratosphaeria destructans]|uniref:Acid phosphatase PHO1-like n=1 Tax=Teratosphaeria destructans TaxID=418781 RepID=A0A9W7SRI7_9PEZI|nr:acid phosphatase PHO1-like [Teratosphaeria destructans]
MLEFYDHLVNVTLGGDLAFANEWAFFMSDPEQRLEKLVAVGPYAGTLEAFTTGVKLRTRYEHLVDQAVAANQTSFWASDSGRVVETAKNFVAGFFGIDWADRSTLHVVPETTDLAGDTLTPGKTCRRYRSKLDPYGRDYGARMLYQWRRHYLPPIIDRLKLQNPHVTWSESEVYSMQELCGFETLAAGRSPWCDVFTHEEWEHFAYARDLLHYYRSGPGNPFSTTLGLPWLNATANLLRPGPPPPARSSSPSSTTATSSPSSPPSTSSRSASPSRPITPPRTAPGAPPTSSRWAVASSWSAWPAPRPSAGTAASTATRTTCTATTRPRSTLCGSTSTTASSRSPGVTVAPGGVAPWRSLGR